MTAKKPILKLKRDRRS